MSKKVPAAFAAAGAAVLLLAGCGSDGDKPAAAKTSASAGSSSGSAAPSATDNSALTAPQLGRQALAALKSASSFRVQATSKEFAFDMHYGAQSSKGTLTLEGSPIELITVGGASYFKAPDAFWAKHVPNSSRSLLTVISGKWVKVPPTDANFGQLAAFGDRVAFIGQLTADTDYEKFTKGPSKSIDGVETVSFVDPADDTTVYVPAKGKPYPLRSEAKSESGLATFSDYDEPFSVAAPPAAQVFDLSTAAK